MGKAVWDLGGKRGLEKEGTHLKHVRAGKKGAKVKKTRKHRRIRKSIGKLGLFKGLRLRY